MELSEITGLPELPEGYRFRIALVPSVTIGVVHSYQVYIDRLVTKKIQKYKSSRKRLKITTTTEDEWVPYRQQIVGVRVFEEELIRDEWDDGWSGTTSGLRFLCDEKVDGETHHYAVAEELTPEDILRTAVEMTDSLRKQWAEQERQLAVARANEKFLGTYPPNRLDTSD